MWIWVIDRACKRQLLQTRKLRTLTLLKRLRGKARSVTLKFLHRSNKDHALVHPAWHGQKWLTARPPYQDQAGLGCQSPQLGPGG